MSAHGVFYKKIRSKSTLFYMGVFLLICFASLNVLYSQTFPLSVWGVMEKKKEAVVNYLEHINNTTQYQYELERLQADKDTEILEALKNKEAIKDVQIQKLNSVVNLYPHDPELYYNLSVLFEEKGMKSQSSAYLKMAQDLDPNIK